MATSAPFSTKTMVNLIGNTIYHSAITTALAFGYAKVGHMIMKSTSTPGLDKLNSSAAAAVFYIGLEEFTRQYLVVKQFLPDDLMK